jgi:hypothetical protein
MGKKFVKIPKTKFAKLSWDACIVRAENVKEARARFGKVNGGLVGRRVDLNVLFGYF